MAEHCLIAERETLALVILHQAEKSPVCWALPGPCVTEIAAARSARAVILSTPTGPVPIRAPSGLSLRSVCSTLLVPLPEGTRPRSGPAPLGVVFASTPDEPHLLVLDPASVLASSVDPCELPALRA